MSESAETELQGLLFRTLTGNAGIMALAGGIYDRVPTDPYKTKTAYVSFGPSDVVEDGADCISSGEHTIQLDVW